MFNFSNKLVMIIYRISFDVLGVGCIFVEIITGREIDLFQIINLKHNHYEFFR